MSTVTVNSTSGLLAALKFAHSGDTILLSAGSYSGVSISNLNFSSPVTITSADPANPATLTDFTITNSTGLTFSGLQLSTAASTTPCPFRITGGGDITLTNLDVYGTPQSAQNSIDGMLIRNSANVTVSNSNFYNLFTGIEELSNTGINISNNTFHNLDCDGIDNAGSTGVVITGNQFSNFTTYNPTQNHPDAIQFWSSTASPLGSDITVSGNVMSRGSGNAFQGIFIQSGPYDNLGGDQITNVTVTNNNETGLLYRGISLQGVEGANVSGNTVTAYKDMESYIIVQTSGDVAMSNNSSMLYSYSAVTNLTQSGDMINAVVPVPTASAPPVITAPSSAIVNQNLATAISGVSLSETGAGSTETFTVKLADTAGNLSATGTGVSGAGTTSLTITGSLAQVSADLATLTDTSSSAATDTITLTASDSLGGVAGPTTLAVTVTASAPPPPPANGPPVLTAPASVTVNQNAATAIAGLSVTETGNTTGETFTVQLADSAGDLSAAGTGISGAGTTALTITGSLAQVNADLATLTSTDAASSADTISLNVSDSLGGAAAPASVSVAVKVHNGPPVIAAPASATVNQNAATAIAGVSLSETGSTTGEIFTVQLADTAGDLSATGAGISGAGTTALTITGSLALVNADLATLTDTDAASSADTISLNVTDSLGGSAAPAVVSVAVKVPNGPPVLTAPASATVNQNAATAIAGLSVTETGNTTGETFTVKLADTAGALWATGMGISGAGTSALIITGSLAQVNADLASLTDTDAASSPDTISLSVSDSLGGSAAPASVSVAVKVPNGRPVIAAPASATANQNAATPIAGLSLSETGNTTGETFTVKLADAAGRMWANGAGVSGAGSAALTITGSLAQVNADLATVSDTAPNVDSITITATDSLGGAATPATIAVSINQRHGHGGGKVIYAATSFVSSMSTLAPTSASSSSVSTSSLSQNATTLLGTTKVLGHNAHA